MVRLLTEDPMKHDFHGQYEIEIPDLEVDEWTEKSYRNHLA